MKRGSFRIPAVIFSTALCLSMCLSGCMDANKLDTVEHKNGEGLPELRTSLANSYNSNAEYASTGFSVTVDGKTGKLPYTEVVKDGVMTSKSKYLSAEDFTKTFKELVNTVNQQVDSSPTVTEDDRLFYLGAYVTKEKDNKFNTLCYSEAVNRGYCDGVDYATKRYDSKTNISVTYSKLIVDGLFTKEVSDLTDTSCRALMTDVLSMIATFTDKYTQATDYIPKEYYSMLEKSLPSDKSEEFKTLVATYYASRLKTDGTVSK